MKSLATPGTRLDTCAPTKEAGSRNNEAVAVAFALKASDSRQAFSVPEWESGDF
jgi:hypothetical protein